MSTLDFFVFLFGVLISAMVGTGFLLLFYGRAYAEQAEKEHTNLSSGVTRLAHLLGRKAS